MLCASRGTLEPLAEQRAKVERGEKLNSERALAILKQARLESVQLTPRGRNDAR